VATNGVVVEVGVIAGGGGGGGAGSGEESFCGF